MIIAVITGNNDASSITPTDYSERGIVINEVFKPNLQITETSVSVNLGRDKKPKIPKTRKERRARLRKKNKTNK